MKYIIIEYMSMEVPVFFPDIVPHGIFAYLNPISAGFTEATVNGAHGSSVGLKLKSRPQDAEIIKQIKIFEEVSIRKKPEITSSPAPGA